MAAQLVIRVDRAERDTFVALCEALDTSAAREIRRFMREWVTANQPSVSEESASAPSSDDTPTQKGSKVTAEVVVEEAGNPRRKLKPTIIPA